MGEAAEKSFGTKLKEKFIAHHLIIFLAIAFTVGLTWPLPGKEVSKPSVENIRIVSSLMIFVIFFISGMRLKTDDVMGTLKMPIPLLLAFFLILVVTPCVGFIPAMIAGSDSAPPLSYKVSVNTTTTITVVEEEESIPKEILIGFAIFCCVPTTLTSGAALVAQGAPRATVLALMITSATNLIGTGSVPFVLKVVLSDIDTSLDPVSILIKLLMIMLVPSILGKGLTSAVPAAAKFSKEQKVPLTVLSGALLVGTVWQSLSRSQEKIVEQPPLLIIATIGCGIGLHLVFWTINGAVLVMPCIPDVHQRRAVFLLASQKTLPVSVAVISAVVSGDGSLNEGLIALPCIMGHLSQLVIDSFLINYWISSDKKAAPPAKADDSQGIEMPLLGDEDDQNAAAVDRAFQNFPEGGVGSGGGANAGGDGGQRFPSQTASYMPTSPDHAYHVDDDEDCRGYTLL